MNTEINQNNGSGNWIAFLFGTVFNLLATITFDNVLETAVLSLIGGGFWALPGILANRFLKRRELKFKGKSKKMKKVRPEEETEGNDKG